MSLLKLLSNFRKLYAVYLGGFNVCFTATVYEIGSPYPEYFYFIFYCERVFAVRENCVSQLEFIISIALFYV